MDRPGDARPGGGRVINRICSFSPFILLGIGYEAPDRGVLDPAWCFPVPSRNQAVGMRADFHKQREMLGWFLYLFLTMPDEFFCIPSSAKTFPSLSCKHLDTPPKIPPWEWPWLGA